MVETTLLIPFHMVTSIWLVQYHLMDAISIAYFTILDWELTSICLKSVYFAETKNFLLDDFWWLKQRC